MENEINIKGLSLNDIARYYFADDIWVNRKYQRKLVWNEEDKKLFIMSLVESIPVPALIYAKSEENDVEIHYEIIDGLQRTYAIISFLTGEFPINVDGKEGYFDLSSCQQTFQAMQKGICVQKEPKLESDFCFKLADSEIPIIVIPEDNAQIEKIFKRINSTGKKLSAQDIRQSTTCNRFAELIKNISMVLRGDYSYSHLINLSDMPQISFGYGLSVEDTFWVRNHIFESFRLKESKDEEIMAKTVISILIDNAEPSAECLDNAYDETTPVGKKIEAKLDEFENDCVFLEQLAAVGKKVELIYNSGKIQNDSKSQIRNEKKFRILFHTIYKALFNGIDLSDIDGLTEIITNKLNLIDFDKLSSVQYYEAIETLYDAIAIGEMNSANDKNNGFLTLRLADPFESQVTDYKLGLVKLGLNRFFYSANDRRNITTEKIAKTLSAMANTNTDSALDGMIYIGIADSKTQALDWERTYNRKTEQVGNHYINGIDAEMETCGITADEYLKFIVDELNKFPMDSELLEYVESNIHIISFMGRSIVCIPTKKFDRSIKFDGEVYVRKGNSTVTKD